MSFYKKTIEDVDLKNKRVLVRVDYNVPLDKDGHITDDYRIRKSLPTIQYLLKQNAVKLVSPNLNFRVYPYWFDSGKPADSIPIWPESNHISKTENRIFYVILRIIHNICVLGNILHKNYHKICIFIFKILQFWNFA